MYDLHVKMETLKWPVLDGLDCKAICNAHRLTCGIFWATFKQSIWSFCVKVTCVECYLELQAQVYDYSNDLNIG